MGLSLCALTRNGGWTHPSQLVMNRLLAKEFALENMSCSTPLLCLETT